jgi:hypothetical protein
MTVVLRLLPLAGEARLQCSGHVSSLNRARAIRVELIFGWLGMANAGIGVGSFLGAAGA